MVLDFVVLLAVVTLVTLVTVVSVVFVVLVDEVWITGALAAQLSNMKELQAPSPCISDPSSSLLPMQCEHGHICSPVVPFVYQLDSSYK